MVDLLIIAAVLAVTGGAGWYVWREKKRGRACIGCPHAGSCPHRGNCSQTREGEK